MSDDLDKTSDLLAEGKEWLNGDHVYVSPKPQVPGLDVSNAMHRPRRNE